MSWDAYLEDDRGHIELDQNYTHNTNNMIAAALVVTGQEEPPQCDGPLGPAIGAAWWYRLNGLSGPDGAQYIDHILAGLRSDPDRFRAMNPNNGWGDYDTLMTVLEKMRDAVPEWPTTWRVSG